MYKLVPFQERVFCVSKYEKNGVEKMSEQIQITFPDGSIKDFPEGITTEEIAASISPGLKKKCTGGKIKRRTD